MSKFFTCRRKWLIILSFFMVGFVGPNPQRTVILGDVEGNWERLNSFLHNNPAFEIDPIDGLTLNANYKLVFMGDAVDKGPDSLKILKTLLKLKRSYPDRVVLILGNRDINKLRLPHELSSSALLSSPNEEAANQPFAAWLEEQKLENKYADGPTRLNWIFKKTMGAPSAFDMRREELSKQTGREYSAQEILESFLSDLDPNKGIMAKYLQLAQLAYVDKANRTLFVHGGLTAESFGTIPGINENISDVTAWVNKLNSWAQEEIHSGIYEKSGAIELVRYQQPIPGTKANQASVVYGRNFDASSNPELIPESLQEILLKQGIDTVVVGHTPVGELPAIISNGRFRIVFVDNSAALHNQSAKVMLTQGVLQIDARSPLPELGFELKYEHQLGRNEIIGTKSAEGLVIGKKGNSLLTYRIDKVGNYFKSVYSTQGICQRLL